MNETSRRQTNRTKSEGPSGTKTTKRATKPKSGQQPGQSTAATAKAKRAEPKKPIRVVAIGASAGGLEPIEHFFANMPTDSGLAFVIVQHLSPDFRSMMDQLLARQSKMKIVQADDGMDILPNVIYLNPPRTELKIADGKLVAREYSDLEPIGFPIDSFFSSMAQDQGENAICIVMSGTGSDGTKGSAEVSRLGGTVIAQDPASSKFEAMPRSCLVNNTAAISAIADDMPELLHQIISGKRPEDKTEPETKRINDPTQAILRMLEARYGTDFNVYKQTTVGRRIRRRALLNQISSLEQYRDYVETCSDELEALYCDLLIGVTSFFRDFEAFDLIRQKALPKIASQMSSTRQIRVWVPGCASGEEAYSLVMLINEFAEEHNLTFNLRVFATDIHFNSLEIADAGIYAAESLKHLPQGYLEKYFQPVGAQFQVKQEFRKTVVFSPHNLVKDPPFTRMDLVSCRNLLIYFDETAQKKLLAFFHFALNKNGVLFLSPSETVGELDSEFDIISKKWRIFEKKRSIKLKDAAHFLALSHGVAEGSQTQSLRENRHAISNPRLSVAERQILTRTYDRILETYAPASLLVDAQGHLVHVFGNAKRFLIVPEGLFTARVTDLVHPDLKLVISAGIERNSTIRTMPFRRTTKVNLSQDNVISVLVSVEDVEGPSKQVSHMLITIEEKSVSPIDHANAPAIENDVDTGLYLQRIKELEHELRSTEESLQTTVEELETSNEELQATNEELMASNEELQSTNEELHSVNEELYTVSSEHQRKIEELTELNSDMNNLFRVTEIGSIFLDNDLKIRRFTPAVSETFNLVAHDVGRPIDHITFKFELNNLLEEITAVKNGGGSIQHEIIVRDTHYLLRIVPYSNLSGVQAGVVLTIVDVTELKNAQRELVEQQNLVSSVIEQQRDIIGRFDADCTIRFVNPAYCAFYQRSLAELIGINFIDLIQKNQRRRIKSVLSKLTPGGDIEYIGEDVRGDGSRCWIQWNFHSILGEDGKTAEIQAVGHDVTEVVEARHNLEQLNDKIAVEQRRLSKIYRLTPVMLHSVSQDGRIAEVSDYWCQKLGYTRDQVVGKNIVDFILQKKDTESYRFEKLFDGEAQDNILIQMKKSDGSTIDARLSAIIAPGSEDGALLSFTVVFDVTDQLTAERELARQNDELKRTNDNLNQFTNIVSHDLTGPLRAIKHTAQWIEEDTTDAARQTIQEHIDRLKDQIGKMSGMLNDLLDYSKAGSIDLPMETFNLPKEISDIFDVTDNAKNISLVIGSVPKNIMTFRAPLNLVLRNLVENAIKYHDKEDGEVVISGDDIGEFWKFSVADDGPGIAPEMHEKIFLPFRKLERRDQVAGNGMGLALVKKAVEANGGEMEVISNPDSKAGTTFTFTWKKLN